SLSVREPSPYGNVGRPASITIMGTVMPRWTTPVGPGGWLTLLLGVLLFLIGAILTVGGVQLATLGGSWYYLIAGLALIASGLLLVLRDVRGAWIYAGTF